MICQICIQPLSIHIIPKQIDLQRRTRWLGDGRNSFLRRIEPLPGCARSFR